MLEVIKFHGQDLYVGTAEDGTRMVALRPVCENIGIAEFSQRRKIQEDPRFSWHHMMSAGADGKAYKMFCLPVSQLNGWLYGINANKVAPEVRDRLLAYQKECQEVLFRYFMPNGGTDAEVYSLSNARFEAFERRLDERLGSLEAIVAVRGQQLEVQGQEIVELRSMIEGLMTPDDEKKLRALIKEVGEKLKMDGRAIVGMLKKTLGVHTPYEKATLARAMNVLNNKLGRGLEVVK